MRGRPPGISLFMFLFVEIYVRKEKCWFWPGSKNSLGYGFYGKISVHRMVYEYFCGPVPGGMELDHTCANPSCCNPIHLEPVTHKENIVRRYKRRGILTHCRNGHEYTLDNSYYTKTRRYCRACRKANRHMLRAKYIIIRSGQEIT
jgi:hypothetical protein